MQTRAVVLTFDPHPIALLRPQQSPPALCLLDHKLELLVDADLVDVVAVLGGDIFDTPIASLALERGGHLRVGLEDHAGDRQPSNAELVAEAVALCAEVGRPVATPRQTREILGLPVKR